MGYQINPAPPLTLHLDLNSAFAAMEQQANPLLRGVPTVITARPGPHGCILAASYEAKLWGIKTGMQVAEGRERCPFLVTRPADPAKYRYIHREIKDILSLYTDRLVPKSIDEFTLDLAHTPSSTRAVLVGQEIQRKIRDRVGEWLTVSVGLAPSRFLAKLASDLKGTEPVVIDHLNLAKVYATLPNLPALPGINWRLERRLKEQGVHTPLDFARADLMTLRAAFRSVLSRDWYLRLRGWEVDSVEFSRRTFGQSYVLPRSLSRSGWLPILGKLVDKAARRMRAGGYSACGCHLLLRYQIGHGGYHRGHTQDRKLFLTPDLLKLASSLIPPRTPPVKHLAVTFFNLSPLAPYQCSLFTNTPAAHSLARAVDRLNERFGPYTLHAASMLGTEEHVHDAIAFGK